MTLEAFTDLISTIEIHAYMAHTMIRRQFPIFHTSQSKGMLSMQTGASYMAKTGSSCGS